MGSPNAPRRLNCANACHAARDKFLVAERGGAINTLDFRWALACGEGLAVVSRLDAKRPGPESTARTDPDLEGFSEERVIFGHDIDFSHDKVTYTLRTLAAWLADAPARATVTYPRSAAAEAEDEDGGPPRGAT